MRRLPLLLVSSVCSLIAVQNIGWAQTMAASDVTRMLAKSQSLDARCNILAEADRQDLMDYLARAEILLAERESVKAARTAIAKGRSAAGEGICGPEQDKFVRGILSAARASTAAEPPVQQATEPPAAAPQPLPPRQVEASVNSSPKLRQAVVEPEPKPVAEVKVKIIRKKSAPVNALAAAPKVKPKPDPTTVATKKKPSSSLNAYAGLAQRYYVELKCRSMSGPAVKKLYATVLANHKQAVAESGPSAVRSVLRNAEVRANARNC
jgi:hypothetical protein